MKHLVTTKGEVVIVFTTAQVRALNTLVAAGASETLESKASGMDHFNSAAGVKAAHQVCEVVSLAKEAAVADEMNRRFGPNVS